MGTQNTADPVERLKIIATNTKKITDAENKSNPGLSCEISEMFTGKSFVLFRYQLLKDVRLVYVPARSIGEYGGEKDNWVWPRHSGDFAFLRAYVAPDGSSAEYNVNNVPFKPKRFLKLTPKESMKTTSYLYLVTREEHLETNLRHFINTTKNTCSNMLVICTIGKSIKWKKWGKEVIAFKLNIRVKLNHWQIPLKITRASCKDSEELA